MLFLFLVLYSALYFDCCTDPSSGKFVDVTSENEYCFQTQTQYKVESFQIPEPNQPELYTYLINEVEVLRSTKQKPILWNSGWQTWKNAGNIVQCIVAMLLKL